MSEDFMEIAKKKITVMGLGTHGGGAGNVAWLHKHGAHLTVTDLRSQEELKESLKELQGLSGIKWVLGEHREEDFVSADMILRNPAIPRNSEYLIMARRAGVRVEMDSSLFMRLSPTRNIIGVTGSKGKSTTTHAVAHFMNLKYAHVVSVGLEGTSPLKALDELRAEDVAVFELSSWRLEALAEHEISPSAAIVTSIYPDHLNTYDSFEQYVEIKQAIVRYQKAHDRVLLNYDDEKVRVWPAVAHGRVAWFSLGPNIPGEGICVRHGRVCIETNRGIVPVFSVDDLPRESDHEKRNILPGIYLAYCNGVAIESIKIHLQHLARLSHRLEKVKEVRGVQYINDSAATIPEATVAALKALAGKRVVLIAGGGNKKLSFEKMAEAIRDVSVRAVVMLPGSATIFMREEITHAFRVPPPVFDAESMEEAVSLAAGVAQAGDVVLLSPGATSFGLFKHEFDRGDQFKRAVEGVTE